MTNPIQYDYDQMYTETGMYQDKIERLKNTKKSNKIRKAKLVALRWIENNRPSALLEIGCGTGDFLKVAAPFVSEMRATDVSSNAIGVAQTDVKNCEFHVGEHHPSLFGARLFDVIVCWEVLEHVGTPMEFLTRIHASLQKGGTVFLSTPNYGSNYVWKDVPNDPRSAPPVHVTFWDRKSIINALEKVGFSKVKVRFVNFPLGSLRRSFGAVSRLLAYPRHFLDHTCRRTLVVQAVRE